MGRIYFDYNATTPLDPRVAEAMASVVGTFGNPSSIHSEGRKARALVDDARVHVGELLHCDHRQVAFTSGGTEAINLAILGSARAEAGRGRHIITSAIEHSAVLNSCKQLESEGWEVTYLAPSPRGVIDPKQVEDAIRFDTVLVSIMMANNEIGTLQPIREIASIARARGIRIHSDAVQALGKIPVNVPELGVDLLSVSSHKIYGPKGAGALYHAPGIDLVPIMRGGSHEQGLRAGTENAAGIHGFGVAARLLNTEGPADLLSLREQLETGLAATSMKIVCEDAPRLPNTVNFYSEAWIGESLVMAFDLAGISVSNGSACSAGIIEPSHVILSLGYNVDVARSVIRVSLGKFTTIREIEEFLRVVERFEKSGFGVRT